MDHHRSAGSEEGRHKELGEGVLEKELGGDALEKELGTQTAERDEDGVSSHRNEDELIRKETGTPGSDESVEEDVPAEQPRDLEATRTTSRTVSVRDLNSIPDGGTKAWLQVLGSFFLFFNSWGLINTFGVYQTYYESSFLASSGASSIAWIGSIQAFLLLLVGSLTGPLYDAGYFRQLLAAGTFFLVFGHMMLSLADKYWQVFLAQGLCIGLGPGMLFVPSVAILSQYFRRRIALSVGVAAAGSSLGGVIYPIVLHKLLPQVGWGWAVRTIGFIALATLIVPNAVMSVRALPDNRRKMWDWSAFRDLTFMLYTLASFIGFMGLYMVFYYIEGFAIDKGYTDENLGFYLLSILNAASTFGRLLPNFIADKLGPFNVFIPAAILSGTLTLCVMAVSSKGGVIAICALYGFASGAFVSIPPTIMVKICPHPGIIGTRMGMSFGLTSIGMLIGAPIGGAILRTGGYNGIWIWGGVLMITGGLITVTSRIAFVGLNPFQRV